MSEAVTFFDTPIGNLELRSEGEKLTYAWFSQNMGKSCDQPFFKEAQRQFLAYFSGDLKVFDLPFLFSGSVFQQRVWEQLQTIPFGRTITYSELARQLGDPLCIRAAAAANGKNPLAILIPCHRVIGGKGELTGYAGGLERKRWLLDHEARVGGTYAQLF